MYYPSNWCQGTRSSAFPRRGNHPDCESDTWFIAGELTGESGRRFAFLTIFNKNRPGRCDRRRLLYLRAVRSGQRRRTGHTRTTTCLLPTCSRVRAQDVYVAADHLDMTYDSGAGTVVWRTCRDEQERLVPYT